MLRSFALVLLLCATAAAAAAPLQPGERVDQDVQAVLDRTGTPGAVVAVFQDGRAVYRKAYGFRDLGNQVPADVSTYFEIGSITKQFTAAAILQLQRAGKLNIDARLAKYLPRAPHASEVTLRQLLSHTGGMPDYFDGPDIDSAATKPATFGQLMARIEGRPLDFPPGSDWSYSNSDYVLLGRVIEIVSHESYRHYVRVHLFGPAGMEHTYTIADEPKLSDMALGYQRVAGRVERASAMADSFGGAAGNIVSTIDDLERWNDALMGGKIVTPADYKLMSTAVQTKAGRDTYYGFGLFVDSVDGQARIGHTGGTFGFTAANEYFPDQHLRIIALTNLVDSPEPGERLTTVVFEALFPDIAAAQARPAPGEDPAVTARAQALFAQIQRGTEDDTQLSPGFGAQIRSGGASRLESDYAPLGPTTAFVYKGERSAPGLKWFDYWLQFGPGSSLQFSMALDDMGKIASVSFN